MHRDGVLLDMARTHRISTKFLELTTQTWNKNICNRSTGNTNPECVLQPLDTTLEATPFVGSIKQLEAWFSQFTGTDVSLPWLTTMSAWDLFKTGVIYTFLLVIGVLAATFIIACLVGWALSSPLRPVRWATRCGVVTLQSTPFVLALVIGLAFATALTTYSVGLGITVCIFVTGLMNGANAGQSISESVISIIRERGDHPPGLFIEAIRRSRIQLQAFLVNASKAVPAASFIGAPELLSSMTDISSFSNSRISTYVFLMLFYMVIVVTVVWLCGKGADWLQKDRTQAGGRHD
jgi:ABC-type amino acid transport system permease subunit